MREILGRRRRLMWSNGPKWLSVLRWSGGPSGAGSRLAWSKRERLTPRAAALTYAEQWRWPVLPGVGHERGTGRRPERREGRRERWLPWREGPSTAERAVGREENGFGRDAGFAGAEESGRAEEFRLDGVEGFARGDAMGRGGGFGRAEGGARRHTCACLRPDCAVPGAHPFEPGLLAATTDARMVDWWWTNRPDAPVVLATGSTVSAVSLPATAGVRALAVLDRMGVPLGPVVATPTRCVLLVAPYSMEELGELLDGHDWVPPSLRYHGRGGYVVLPPSQTGTGSVGWERAPRPGPTGGAPWLPELTTIVDTLVEAGVREPDSSRLAY